MDRRGQAHHGGLGQGPQPLRRRPDHQGKENQDHEAHDEAPFEARHAVGDHRLAVLLARRWQLAPEVGQALLGGPVEPALSGMRRACSLSRSVAWGHQGRTL
jgi:hypothetical protein